MRNPAPESRDPLEAQIARAHDEVVREKWAPARYGIVPHVRIGKRWFSVLWLLPIGFVGLVLAAAVAHELSLLPAVKGFIARYPGQPSGTVAYKGCPVWLRLAHVFNLFLMPRNCPGISRFTTASTSTTTLTEIFCIQRGSREVGQ